MKIATVLFTYNRPVHTQKVLESLAQNEKKPEKLIIFQDGVKPGTNREDWENVRKIIGSVDWCETEIHITEINQGLARSISSGISKAFEEYDALIVLEDDCVTHPKFMSYMYEGLYKYQEQKRVYGIGGYAAVDINQEGEANAYFIQRICSEGWGTWRDRWEQYERDYSILKRIKGDPKAYERLQVWGNDLEAQLLGNITGQCNSWAVFWALKVIEQDGFFLSPYESLIMCIGYDGSGTHGGIRRWDTKCREINNMTPIILPDKLDIMESARQGYIDKLCTTPPVERNRSYRELLCKWITLKQQGREIVFLYTDRKIAFWGKGWLLDLMQAEFGDRLQIQCIIETHSSSEEYKGIPIYSVDEIPAGINTVIVIPFCDIEIIKRKINRRRADIMEIVGVNEIIK